MLADSDRQRFGVSAVLGGASADRFEIETVGFALRQRQAARGEADDEGEKEEGFPVHSAQQFRLRQTR